MTKNQLKITLAKQIPLSKAMGIQVMACDSIKGVRFQLPLKPNRNHKNTAFGGTLVAAQALACWAYSMVILNRAICDAEVVVQVQQSEFLLPVAGDFQVVTEPISTEAIQKFLKTLERKSRARLRITARVIYGGRTASTYWGQYVAISSKSRVVY